MDAYYEQGLFTNGLSTIQTDELHSYEEGIQVLGQSLLLDFGNPKQLERAMATAAALEKVTGINKAGHRHIRTSYFSGTTMAAEGVWGWQKPNGFLAFHPAIVARRLQRRAARRGSGCWSWRTGCWRTTAPTSVLRTTVRVRDRRGQEDGRGTDRGVFRPGLAAAVGRLPVDRRPASTWRRCSTLGPRALSGISANALDHLGLRDSWRAQLSAPEWMANRSDSARHVAWQMTGDVRYLESLYEDQVRAAAAQGVHQHGRQPVDRPRAGADDRDPAGAPGRRGAGAERDRARARRVVAFRRRGRRRAGRHPRARRDARSVSRWSATTSAPPPSKPA